MSTAIGTGARQLVPRASRARSCSWAPISARASWPDDDDCGGGGNHARGSPRAEGRGAGPAGVGGAAALAALLKRGRVPMGEKMGRAGCRTRLAYSRRRRAATKS